MSKRTLGEAIKFYKEEFPDGQYKDFSLLDPYIGWNVSCELKNENGKKVFHVYLESPDGKVIDLTEDE